MNREVRRVPPNWEHPRHTKDSTTRANLVGAYIPLHNRDFDSVAMEWMAGNKAWNDGTHEDCEKYKADCQYFWQWWGAPPCKDYYRPAFAEEPTWYQVYETVSAGTPVTPPFATKLELVDWLVEKGDIYGTRHKIRYRYSQAEELLEKGRIQSMVIPAELDRIQVSLIAARDNRR